MQNQIDTQEINTQVDAVSKDAETTLNEVKRLKEQYRRAEEELAKRAGKSVSAKGRAQELFEQASKLLQGASSKEKELKGLCKMHFLYEHFFKNFYSFFFF